MKTIYRILACLAVFPYMIIAGFTLVLFVLIEPIWFIISGQGIMLKVMVFVEKGSDWIFDQIGILGEDSYI